MEREWIVKRHIKVRRENYSLAEKWKKLREVEKSLLLIERDRWGRNERMRWKRKRGRQFVKDRVEQGWTILNDNKEDECIFRRDARIVINYGTVNEETYNRDKIEKFRIRGLETLTISY